MAFCFKENVLSVVSPMIRQEAANVQVKKNISEVKKKLLLSRYLLESSNMTRKSTAGKNSGKEKQGLVPGTVSAKTQDRCAASEVSVPLVWKAAT